MVNSPSPASESVSWTIAGLLASASNPESAVLIVATSESGGCFCGLLVVELIFAVCKAGRGLSAHLKDGKAAKQPKRHF